MRCITATRPRCLRAAGSLAVKTDLMRGLRRFVSTAGAGLFEKHAGVLPQLAKTFDEARHAGVNLVGQAGLQQLLTKQHIVHSLKLLIRCQIKHCPQVAINVVGRPRLGHHG